MYVLFFLLVPEVAPLLNLRLHLKCDWLFGLNLINPSLHLEESLSLVGEKSIGAVLGELKAHLGHVLSQHLIKIDLRLALALEPRQGLNRKGLIGEGLALHVGEGCEHIGLRDKASVDPRVLLLLVSGAVLVLLNLIGG